MCINLHKCLFAESETEWLEYKFTKLGISPFESQMAAILANQPPNTLKRLHSFLGSVHNIGKFILHLTQLRHPFRPLLRKSAKVVQTELHTKHFNILKDQEAQIFESCPYNPKQDVRKKRNASRSELGAAPEQSTPDG